MLSAMTPSNATETWTPRAPEHPEYRAENCLDLVKLPALMSRTSGTAAVTIGLIDGPVFLNHPDLVSENIEELSRACSGDCTIPFSAACRHGTFVAGILSARRGSAAPALCPECTLLIRPVFVEHSGGNAYIPSATPEDLAAAITDCVEAGVRLINLSVALVKACRANGERILNRALDHAANRGVIVVAAAGNQSSVGGTALTQHPWSLPVSACDLRGRPLSQSNFGSSIGRRGLSAPGEQVNSLASEGGTFLGGGTSAATPLVTGALALVWSEFPGANANQIRLAVKQAHARLRPALVPPLLNAWQVYRAAAQMLRI